MKIFIKAIRTLSEAIWIKSNDKEDALNWEREAGADHRK
jgi:hypothetical protein